MLAFLLIVGVSYYLVATSLIGLVGDSLFSDRMRQDHAAADKLAAELGPLYAERGMEKAQQLLESAGGELGGRLMLLDQSGKVVGTHSGAVRYTLGQRKGLGLAMGAPVYVCGKDMQANTVTVGPESELFDRIVYAEDVNWIAIPALTGPLRVTARTRYHQAEQQATVYPAENGFRLEFDQPQRAPTPGQAAVLYQGDVVLGGGTITRVEK